MEQLLARTKEGIAQQAGPVRQKHRFTTQCLENLIVMFDLQGLITAHEAEHLIEALRSYGIDQVVTSCWC